MRIPGVLLVAMLSVAVLGVSGCEEKTPAEKAVDGTKDAMDMREHEKMKDAAEDAKDAVDNAAECVKDETQGN